MLVCVYKYIQTCIQRINKQANRIQTLLSMYLRQTSSCQFDWLRGNIRNHGNSMGDVGLTTDIHAHTTTHSS